MKKQGFLKRIITCPFYCGDPPISNVFRMFIFFVDDVAFMTEIYQYTNIYLILFFYLFISIYYNKSFVFLNFSII